MHFKELSQGVGRVSALTRIKTRPRPRQETQANPHLIPLLRSPTITDVPALIGEVGVPCLRDDLAPMRGIIFSLMLILPVWGGVAGVLWAVLR